MPENGRIQSLIGPESSTNQQFHYASTGKDYYHFPRNFSVLAKVSLSMSIAYLIQFSFQPVQQARWLSGQAWDRSGGFFFGGGGGGGGGGYLMID